MTDKIPEEIRENFNALVSDEMKYSIITAISMYETLNLKNLARLVGRPETTTIRYVKQLLEEKLIDVDAEKTATSWGKFYKLSDYVEKLYAKQHKILEEREEQMLMEYESVKEMSENEQNKFVVQKILSREDLDESISKASQLLSFSHNVQNMIVKEIGFTFESILKLVESKGKKYVEENLIIDPSDIEVYNLSLSLSKTSQLIRLVEFFHNTYKELVKLKEEFKQEMDRENVPEEDRKFFFNSLFTGSLDFSYKLKNEE